MKVNGVTAKAGRQLRGIDVLQEMRSVPLGSEPATRGLLARRVIGGLLVYSGVVAIALLMLVGQPDAGDAQTPESSLQGFGTVGSLFAIVFGAVLMLATVRPATRRRVLTIVTAVMHALGSVLAVLGVGVGVGGTLLFGYALAVYGGDRVLHEPTLLVLLLNAAVLAPFCSLVSVMGVPPILNVHGRPGGPRSVTAIRYIAVSVLAAAAIVGLILYLRFASGQAFPAAIVVTTLILAWARVSAQRRRVEDLQREITSHLTSLAIAAAGAARDGLPAARLGVYEALLRLEDVLAPGSETARLTHVPERVDDDVSRLIRYLSTRFDDRSTSDVDPDLDRLLGSVRGSALCELAADLAYTMRAPLLQTPLSRADKALTRGVRRLAGVAP